MRKTSTRSTNERSLAMFSSTDRAMDAEQPKATTKSSSIAVIPLSPIDGIDPGPLRLSFIPARSRPQHGDSGEDQNVQELPGPDEPVPAFVANNNKPVCWISAHDLAEIATYPGLQLSGRIDVHDTGRRLEVKVEHDRHHATQTDLELHARHALGHACPSARALTAVDVGGLVFVSVGNVGFTDHRQVVIEQSCYSHRQCSSLWLEAFLHGTETVTRVTAWPMPGAEDEVVYGFNPNPKLYRRLMPVRSARVQKRRRTRRRTFWLSRKARSPVWRWNWLVCATIASFI
ncbi:hypothetical protein V8E36_009744 [Tilletia maclaganii]